MATKHISIFTGGGDVLGMKCVIKGVTYRAVELGGEELKDYFRITALIARTYPPI